MGDGSNFPGTDVAARELAVRIIHFIPGFGIDLQ